jgi:adenosylhomocysteine nucleosidase
MNERRIADWQDDRAGHGTAAGGLAPAPLAVDVGIVAALAVEVGFLIDRLTSVRRYMGPRHTVVEGECGGKLVGVVVSGMGREAARRGAELLLGGHRPRWLVSAGFAGALDPALERYAIVMPNQVVDTDSNHYTIDVRFPPPTVGSPTIRTGRLLTVDRLIATASEKADLRRKFSADFVDMETSAVAGLCSARAVRFLSIRVISDDAATDLPHEIATLLTRTGTYRIGAALRALWRRPSRIKEFWALHEQAQEAADRLARFTVAALERLA